MTAPGCGTRAKRQFRSMNTARKAAVTAVHKAIRRDQTIGPIYGYRCECGYVHLTKRREWDGVRHVMLARPLSPARAYRRGALDAFASVLRD